MKHSSKTNNLKKIVKLINKALEDEKAFDVKYINLQDRSTIADYMIIASGTSSRHVSSMSNNLIKKIKSFGVKSRKPEGLTNSDWVLIDANDIVIHLFRPEVREFYKLEKMWETPSFDNFNSHESK